MPHPKLDELLRRDRRYPYEAYEFVFDALAHTQKRLARVPPPGPGSPAPEPGGAARGPCKAHHVSGKELLEGVRDLAQREFGLMARTVFRLWGIDRTDDFGEIVFNLIEVGLMSQTPTDSRADFQGVFDLDRALVEGYRIELPHRGDRPEEAD